MSDAAAATLSPTWFDYAMLASGVAVAGAALARGWLGDRFARTRIEGVLRPAAPWSRWLAVTGLMVLAFIMVNALAAMVFAPAHAAPPLPLETQAAIALATFGVLVPTAILLPRQVLFDAADPPESRTLEIGSRDVVRGAALLLVVYPLVHATSIACIYFYVRIGGGVPSQIAHQGLEQMIAHRASPWAWALAACALVAAPIFEEIVFRGLLQTALVKATGSARAGVVLAAALFAGAHAGNVESYALPVLFVLGVCLGLVYEHTGRLGAAVGLHMAFNMLQFALALAFAAGPGASV